MSVKITSNSGSEFMRCLFATCCRSFGLLAFVLLTGSFSLANAQSWNGSGPFPPGADSGTVHALAIDPAAGIVYAGTASGTVFALADPTLSQLLDAVDDFAITNPGMAIGVLVLTNDIDPEGALDTSSVATQSDPIHGTVTVAPDGTVTYTPDPGFVGEDSFTYTARDLAGNTSNVATVTIRVNAPPTAEDDTASGVQNEPVTIDVLANDSDPDGSGSLDPATVAISDPPENGSAIVEADGRITYQSAANFTGVDTFAYTVGDGDGAVSNEATVSVTVSETPNVPPTATDDVATTNDGTPVTIDVLANDRDADGTLNPATVTVQNEPGEGSVAVNADGTVTYTPDSGFSGTDTFTYTVADDAGEASDAATVTVTVNAAAKPPSPPSGGGGGGGGGATGLLLLVVMTFALLLRRSMNVECTR